MNYLKMKDKSNDDFIIYYVCLCSISILNSKKDETKLNNHQSICNQYQLNTNTNLTNIRICDSHSLDGRLLAILVHGPH